MHSRNRPRRSPLRVLQPNTRRPLRPWLRGRPRAHTGVGLLPVPDGVQRRRVVGCELDPFLADHLRSVVATRYADGVLHVIEGDMFAVDLEAVRVDLFVLYLLPLGLGKLKGQLRRWLEGGGDGEGEGEGRRKRRIVTITYSIPGWECDRAIEVGDTVKQWLFYYELKDVRDE
ncbi:hypothetical protein BCR33DRAFT_262220 [Rhizoclosmatium globosum]|uniref:rRNA adenine N(6)-methyltransferase n=1 Tax=Rhizoclosmatium globosum TaxID=329046 RepID=A0A1Y2C992_9FUNG|nr:hypothetical protein BCR33DRAFT_262220 [Rhizoclosmatium globosum]|eukprot:ORY43477.1 hypothetical protein BCR33DRAFT_262220 [Rhizoclosmatium globosum]